MVSPIWLGVVICLVSVQGPGDRSPEKRNIELEAAPAENLIPALGKLYGIELRAEGQTRGDVLMVYAKDVTLKDVMDRIAKVDSAKWEKAPDGVYQLIRTEEQRGNQIKADRIKEANSIREQRAKRSKQMPDKQLSQEQIKELLSRYSQLNDQINSNSLPQGTDAYARASREMQNIRQQFPAKQFYRAIENSIDPMFLASLPDNKRVDLSDVPNSVQLQLPFRINNLYDEFIKLHQAFFDASGTTEDLIKPGNALGQPWGQQRFLQRPERVLVSILKFPEMGGAMMLYLFGDEWRYEEHADDLMMFDTPKFEPTNKQGQSFLESLPDESQEYITELMKPMALTEKRGQVKPSLMEKILDPVNHEPLALFTGAILLANAKAKNSNLIAVLPDQIWLVVRNLQAKEKATLEDVANLTLSTGRLESNESDNWIEIQPQYPSKTWENRIDRNTLKSLFKVCNFTQPNLELLAGFAFKLPSSFSLGIPLTLRYFTESGTRTIRDIRDQYNGLRFYGLLTNRQKAELTNGSKLTYANLTPDQRRALFDAVYSGPVQLSLDYNKSSKSLKQMMAFDIGITSEELPNGIAPDTQISLAVESSDSVLPFYGDHYNYQSLTADQLGAELARSEAYRREGLAIPEARSYRYLTSRKLRFTFVFAPDITGTLTLTDCEQDAGGRLLKFSDLPQAFRDQVMKQYEITRKAYQGTSTSDGGSIKP